MEQAVFNLCRAASELVIRMFFTALVSTRWRLLTPVCGPRSDWQVLQFAASYKAAALGILVGKTGFLCAMFIDAM